MVLLLVADFNVESTPANTVFTDNTAITEYLMRAGSYLAILTLAVLVGCNDGPFSYVPVSGTVTYEDGTPIPAASIQVWFKSLAPPIDENTHPRPAKAGVNIEDGSFDSVTSYKPGDGLVPGEHKVALFVYGANGQISPLVDKEYTNAATSPLTVNTDELPLKILVPRPKKGKSNKTR